MHRLLLLVCLVSVPLTTSALAQLGGPSFDWEDGWVDLGGHHPDFGWQSVGEATWTQDANKVVSDGKQGWLFTTTQWADFELEVDFRCLDKRANSGIFIRSVLEPTDPTKDCYEVNIAPADNPYPTGSLVGLHQTDLPPVKTDHVLEWIHLRIVATGGRIRVYRRADAVAEGSNLTLVFGETCVADYADPDPITKGYIGLQSNGGRVEFKNVRVRPLEARPVFNGKNLDGWITKLAGPAKFNVTEQGELNVLGGSGQLESDGEYGNFILQFECKVNGDGLNSGVFFRCIPGERMNGYECQISNAYENDQRDVPSDFGTGGIYRRVEARTVVADDHEWFGVTVHADGPHIATWVNGLQVVDWTDTREPDDNPRRGLRLAPGTFCIQAHDPTTDLLFRNLRVVELP